MLYRALRRIARVAIGWYYADVVVEGDEQLPANGPLLLVANHPNALVDAMLVGIAVPRRILLTGKATLFEHPALAAGLRAIGVVPLRRAKDERTGAANDAPAVSRNADAFATVTTALAKGGAVLVFPEGISHDAPAIAPLRTGAARMALMAHQSGVNDLQVIAIGLTYEEKERPRSRILVRIGKPLRVEHWIALNGSDASSLTAEIDRQLRRVTLNFASADRARRAAQLARALDAVASDAPPIHHPRSLGPEAALAHRIEVASGALADAPESTVRLADAFIAEVAAFERRLAAQGIALPELRVSPRRRHGAWFVFRESALASLALPVAIVDRIAHDLPVRLARTIARRSLASDPSRDQPAMRTILFATGFLFCWYVAIGVTLARWLGIGVAVVAIAVMILSAGTEIALRDRAARGWQRARSYLALRADPAFRSAALAEAGRLLDDAQALEQALLSSAQQAPVMR